MKKRRKERTRAAAMFLAAMLMVNTIDLSALAAHVKNITVPTGVEESYTGETEEGSPSNAEKPEAFASPSNAKKVKEVRDLIDTLPDVSELEEMSREELGEIHEQAQEAYDAFQALTDEEKAELREELAKLLDLLEYLTKYMMNTVADTSAKTPERKVNYTTASNYIGNCIFANGTAITIEEAPSGTSVWYMDGSTKTYVTENDENGENLSGWKIFVGSTNLDGMTGVNGSVTMIGGTVKEIYAGQVSGYFRGRSNITITGGTVTDYIVCNARYGTNTTADYVGTVTIFDAVGTTIKTANGKADNIVKKKNGAWSVSGNGVIPGGVTLTVDSGETLTVPTGATLTNNGTLVNNGTMNLYGPVRGTAFTGNGTVNCYAAYIEGVSSDRGISASMDGNTYSLQSGDTYLQSGRLYLWLPSGNAKVTLNRTDYYGVTEAGKQTELTSNYVDMSNVTISGIPTEIGANTNVTLSAKLTGNTTLTPTIRYELDSATAQGAALNGSTLYAAGAGTVTVKVKVSDGYTTKSQDFEITVKHTPVTGLSEEIPASMIVNSKIDLPTVRPSNASYQAITWSIISGQRDTGATVTNNVLTATKAGTFTIRAIVENGTAYGTNYTKEFTVTVTAVNDGSSLDISAANITISQNSDGTLKVEYGGYGGDGYKNFAESDSIVITGTTTTNRVIVKSGSPNVVLSDCNISLSSAGNSPFEIQSGATVNLTLSGTNTLKGAGSANDTSSKAPGISVPSRATVKIGGTGVLYATGGFYSAGIGGGISQASGTIIISGGSIVAQGGSGDAAGIGGGGGNPGGSGGNTTITGGTVTAISTSGGAGIGGGYKGSGGTVIITGGNVKAQCGNYRANDIGAGSYGSGGTLKDSNGNSVSKVTFTLDGMTETTSITAIEGSSYGVNGVSTLDTNKLYFYLPSDAKLTSVTTANEKYICNGNNTFYKNHEYNGSCDTNCSRCGAERDVTEAHHYENGFCTKCNGYQSAVWNSSENYYEISNAGQLYWFAALTNGKLNDGTTQNNSANAVLKEDITVNSSVIVNGSLASDTSGFRKWTPIGDYSNNGEKPYSGIFDGNGHTVSGVYMTASVDEAGFFAELTSGNIINLTVADSYFESTADYVGGIVGWIVTGKVERCASVNCIVTGRIEVGGIAGVCSNSEIANCYSTSKITASSECCGGISGWTQRTSTVQNCYFAGQNNCNSANGAITASPGHETTNVTVKDCYYDSNVSCQGDVVKTGNKGALTKTNIVKVDTNRFKTGEIAYLLNGSESDGVWKQTIGKDSYPNFTGKTVYQITDGYPKYTNYASCTHSYNGNGFCTTCGGYQPAKLNDGVYEISNAGQLMWFAAFANDDHTNINGRLMKDIDASSAESIGIGSSDKKYAGTFDGNGYTINMKLNGSGSVALFPYVSGATIKNLTVKGYVTASDKYAASLVGQAEGSVTIEKCISTVEITSTVSGDGTHGGLVGVVNSGTLNINNCGFTGVINGSDTTSCGGFVGWSGGTTKISNSFVAATFGVKSDGGNTFSRGNNITVTNCYYLNKLGDVPSGAAQKDETAFRSGKVAYQLNGKNSDGVWKQTIGKDDYPNFTGLTVFYDADANPQYFNDISFTINGNPATAENAMTVSSDLAYGRKWNEYLSVKDGITASVDKKLVTGTYTIVPKTGNLTDRPGVGTQDYRVMFTSTDHKYTDVEVFSGSITVTAKEITVSAGSYKVSKVYDGTTDVNTGNVSGALDISGILDGDAVTVTETPTAYTSADVGGQSYMDVTLALRGTDKSGYTLKSSTVSVPCEITKAALTVDGTVSATASYGTMVKDITVGGLVRLNGNVVTGTWSFENSEAIPNVNDTTAYKATFTPTTGAGNYEPLTADVTPVITKVDPTTPTSLEGFMGNRLSSVELPDGWTWDAPDTNLDEEGYQRFAASYAGDQNHKESSGAELTVEVIAKEGKTLTVTMMGWDYGETANTPSYTPAAPEGTAVSIQYAGWGNTTYAESTVVPNEAGNYTVKVSYETASEIYTGTRDFSIVKANLSGVSVSQTGTLTYNGKPQTAVVETHAVSVNDHPVRFTYSETEDGTYSTEVPSFTDVRADGYTVYYRASAANHNDHNGSFLVTIMKAAPTVKTPPTADVTYGDAVDHSDIKGDMSVKGSFEWNGVSSYGDASEAPKTMKATFTPDDTTNYSCVDMDVSVTIHKAAYNGVTAAAGSAKSGGSNTVDLSSLIMSGGKTAIGTASDSNAVLESCSIEGNTLLKFSFKDTAAVGNTITIPVRVSDCTNYSDYTITVTLTADAGSNSDDGSSDGGNSGSGDGSSGGGNSGGGDGSSGGGNSGSGDGSSGGGNSGSGDGSSGGGNSESGDGSSGGGNSGSGSSGSGNSGSSSGSSGSGNNGSGSGSSDSGNSGNSDTVSDPVSDPSGVQNSETTGTVSETGTSASETSEGTGTGSASGRENSESTESGTDISINEKRTDDSGRPDQAQPAESPQENTSTQSRTAPWVALLCIFACGSIVLLFLKRRTKK